MENRLIRVKGKNEMKKALLVTTVSGFVPQFEMNNVRSLQDFGFEVHYATNYNNVSYGTDNSRLDGTGIVRHQVDFVRSPYDIRGNIRAYRQLCRVMDEEDFELLHCHTPMGSVLARMAAVRYNRRVAKVGGKPCKVIYTAHGFHFFKGAGLANRLFYYNVERYLSKYTDVQITMNREDFANAKRAWNKGCKVAYIPGVGIDTDYFSLAGISKTNAEEINKNVRKSLGISEDTPLFLSAGELIPRKNHESVLRALAEIVKESKAGSEAKDGFGLRGFKYVICGHGKLDGYLKNRVNELGLSEYVIFAGYCQNIRDYYIAADCYIFPSLQEGMPIALLEAAVTGITCICSNIRGNTDIEDVFSNVTCYKDADELREMLGTALKGYKVQDYGKRLEFLAGQREKVKEAFDREKVAETIREIYREVIGN
ncbi:MAG: glycosyltransferase [Lachnospiraceae bacterium]|nr:glycosyltransferase [Lachnospiraceae bacterium]